jgi:hypothetical protein
MFYWFSKRLRADQGGVCHVSRASAKKHGAGAVPFRQAAKIAGVLAATISAIAGVVSTPVVSRLNSLWHPRIRLENPQSIAEPVTYVTTMVTEEVKRKIYPYSIVAGGAQTLHEAKWAMNDPAVQANYAAIDFSQLKQVKLETNLTGYVSYRWGDKIYWTKKRLTLKAGETVFTDGVHIVRGRCLNCYSALPMSPTRPTEPTEKAFDLPSEVTMTQYSFPKLPVMVPVIPIPPGELTPGVPALIPAMVGTTALGGLWFPLIPIIPPIHRHPGQPNTPGSPGSPSLPGVPPPGSPPGSPPGVPPIAVVPEPRYGWLLMAGFIAAILARRLRVS